MRRRRHSVEETLQAPLAMRADDRWVSRMITDTVAAAGKKLYS